MQRKYNKQEKSNHLKSVLKCIGGTRYIISASFFNILEGAFKTSLAVMGGYLLDVIQAHDRNTMNQILLLSILLTAGIFICIFAKDYLIGLYLERGLINLKRKTIHILNKAKLSWLDGMHTGELSSRITNDLNSLTGSLRPVLIMGISVVVLKLISLGYMIYANLKLTLIIFAFVPVLSFMQWSISKQVKHHRAKNLEAVGKLVSAASDSLGAFETVKSLSLENEMKNRFAAAQKNQVKAEASEILVDTALTPITFVGEWLPRILVFIFGGTFVMKNEISIGQLVVFITLSNSTINAFSSMQHLYVAIRRLSASCVRIAQLWELPKERENGDDNLPVKNDNGEAVLSFADVSFSYQTNNLDRSNLEDISFHVKKGEVIAFVGESGGGKSTILKLIASLYEPSGGCITFAGRDVVSWELKSLRERIAYVTQETFLFAGTVKENISCGRKDVCQEDIDMAVSGAGLSSFISSLPMGLETQIGERGIMLSGGQRQRLSIARAILTKSDVLLLDEATSALDKRTEEDVLSSLAALPYKPAIIVVAHRLSTIKSADRIYVIEKGCIVEYGNHDDLKKSGGAYAGMLSQMIGEEMTYEY